MMVDFFILGGFSSQIKLKIIELISVISWSGITRFFFFYKRHKFVVFRWQITWRIIPQPDFTQSHGLWTRRAQLVCDTPDSLRDENRYLGRVFHKSNYNADFIKRNIYRPTEADPTNRNPTPLTTVTIPCIKGTCETISRILQLYNIRVAHNPTTTLRQLLTNVKDRDKPNNRQGEVYKINCSDCQASYIGETGRNLWLTRDWLNTNEPQKMVMLTITLLYTINWQTTTSTGTLLNA